MSRVSLDLVAVGNALVDHVHRVSVLPKRDDGVCVLDRHSGPGGVESNVAAAAALLGLRVGLIARVGADSPGAMVLQDCRQRGVDVTRVQVGAEDETAYSLVFVDPQGDRIMTGGQGVLGLTLDDEDDAYIRRARVCFASGYVPWPVLERLAGLCSGPGSPAFVFDLPGRFDDLKARGLVREHITTLLHSVDLFLTDRETLSSYTLQDDLEAGLAVLHAGGVRRASVSDGDRGIYLVEADGETRHVVHLPAFPVHVVDTTGAGDVLHAALIAEWLLGKRTAAVAGRFAAAAAALSCQGLGARSALPSRAEAEALAASR